LIPNKTHTVNLRILARLSLVFCSLFISEVAFTQSIGGNIFTGNIIRHREFLTYDQPDFTTGFEIEYVVKKNPASAWQQFWKLPGISHHLHFNNFGNKEQLGNSIGYYPSIAFKLFGKERFNMFCQIGNGIAYFNNPFDIKSNQQNNAIGSHWNSMIVLKFQGKIKVQEKLYINFGPQVFHYSNGSAKAPNTGINNLTLNLGLKYSFTEPPLYQKRTQSDSERSWQKLNYEINIGLGFRQINIPNSLNYKVPQIGFFLHYNLYEFFRLVTGFSYEYNYADYHFSKTQFVSEDLARSQARDFQFKISGDFIFGNLFSRFQFGYYLPIEDKEIDSPFSTMFSLNYARRLVNNNSPKMFVGVGVRSHKFVAQYLSLNLGFIF